MKGRQKRIDNQKQAIASQQEQLARQEKEIDSLTALYCGSHPAEGFCAA